MAFESLILAAGVGRRLGAAHLPKVLAEVAGEPLLVRMLGQLRRLGMSQATIAVGFGAQQVRDAVTSMALDIPVHFVENEQFEATNNSFSLHLCGAALMRGGLLIEGDVIADEPLLSTVLDAPEPDIWAVRSPGDVTDGAFLEGDDSGVLRSLVIVRPGEALPRGFKSTGILKLSPHLGARLRGWLAAEIQERRDRYYDLVFADHLTDAAIRLLVVDQGRWLEIDSPADLDRARQLFGARG